jgi:hypothetical protein
MTTGIDIFNKDTYVKRWVTNNKNLASYCGNPLIVGLIIVILILLIIIYIIDINIKKVNNKKVINIFLSSYLVCIVFLFFNNTILCNQLIKKNENTNNDMFSGLMNSNAEKMVVGDVLMNNIIKRSHKENDSNVTQNELI